VLLYLAPRAWTTIAALAAWALAMHAKEVAAVGLALVLPLADVLIRRLPVGRAVRRFLPVAALGVVATALYGGNVLAQLAPAAVSKATSGAAASLGDSLLVTAASLPSVARLLVFPKTLSADYPPPRPEGLLDARVLGGLALAAVALAAIVLAARRAPLVAFAVAWIVAMYLPLSNVVPLGPHFIAERYLYVPSFGACLLAALGLDAIRRRTPAGGLALLALLVVSGALRSMARVPEWHDSVSLWESALRAVPEGSSNIHSELGLALSVAGRKEEAIEQMRRSLASGPEKADTLSNLGIELMNLGRNEEAIPYFVRALEIWPNNPVFHYNLGSAYLRAGRLDDALRELRIAASDETWQSADPAFGAALAARGLTEQEFRRSIEQWLAENAAKIEALRR
jgi:tetratricopeptide (TPR) repeat protein